MKLQARLSLTTASIAILALIVVLAVSSFIAKSSLDTATREKMLVGQTARYGALQRYLIDTRAQMEIMAAAPSTRDSLIEFARAFDQLGENARVRLQQNYVIANEYPRQQRDRFSVTEKPDAYDQVHLSQHERYRNRHRFYDMDDLLLIDPNGNVIYSMLKEKDFATNLLTGPWRDSGLARAVKPLLSDPVAGVASFADFSLYPASDNLPMAFLALPVFDADNQRFIGVIATKLSSTSLNTLMSDHTGLGENGETFLVNRDGWMLTDSRFESHGTALRKQLKTEAVRRVLAGEEGVIEGLDYRGVASYIQFKPIYPYQGTLGDKALWGIIVKTDRDEALRGLSIQLQALLIIGGLLALLASLFGIWAAKSVSSPIVAIQNALTKLAHGEEAQVPGLERRDEIGSMAQAAESFRQMSQQIERGHWLNEHLTGLTNLVSSQFSMTEVPEAILKYLCQCLDIPVAALYLCDEHKVYRRVGMHGLARRGQAEDHFSLGTGLVGQCARDRQAIVLSPVPAGLAVISTGLSEFEANELVLYPIPHKDEVLGVLELAILHRLTPHQHEFLAAAANGLGLHLANLQAAEHNLTLLNETRKQAEVLAEQQQRIEEASRYARSLIEAALDPLVTISAQGRIMDVNSSTENITGIPREKLIGSDFSDYFTEPDQARRGYQQAFSQGSVTDYPLAIRHVSGRITDVLYNASVYYDAEGKVAGVFAAARDVTEAKQQQEALRQNNEELTAQRQRIEEASRYARSLIEASLDPLVTIGTAGQIMDVNSATEKVTGVSRDQLIGSDFCNYFTDPEQARSGYRQVFSEGSVIDFPLAIRHVSGRIIDVLYNASVYYDAEGRVAGVFAAARDVTEAKQQQEALRQTNEEMKALTEELKAQNEEFRANQEELRAQQEEMLHKNQMLEAQRRELDQARKEAEARARELSRANQYKSDFLANMSHELRTPLNSILILAKNLSENEDGNLSADQVESATVISESGSQLLTLINDILDLSKIEAGRFELFNEEFAVSDAMSYLRRTFAPLADKKGIGFEIAVDPATPELIIGDRQRITQILINLLSNAVKFTDAGQVKLSVRRREDSLQFDILDTGIGIPPDKLDAIFGAFQQGDGSTSRKYGGSGLGLAISKRLAELMGGSISVASTLGRGSTFTVTLPLDAASTGAKTETVAQAPAPRPKPSPRPIPLGNAPVLLVEDDSRLVSILERLIDTLGFAVVSVESGEKALTYISHSRPCGVLLDLGLPGMQGMEVLRRLKDDPATADIPVFIMSGAQDTGEARTLGALGFLKKPVTKDSIGAAIRAMLGQNPASGDRKSVLVIEDTKADVLALQRLFRHDALDIVSMQTGHEALEWLSEHHADAIILDLQLPDVSGFDWLQRLDIGEHPPIIVFSARELTGDELFQLRRYADAVVTKGDNTERLHEELLRVLSTGRRQPQATAPATPPAAGRRLLLVDDDVRNLFALAKTLRRKGFNVEVVPSGAKALELLRQQQRFDAVLTDIMMPDMDGYALMDNIRKLGYTDLPLIAVTAKAMPGDIEHCLEAGANDYVPKPVDIDKLLEVLGRWL